MAIRGMKAATAPDDLGKIKLPKLGSAKINGVRGIVLDGVLMSYNMKPIKNDFVQSCFGRTEFNGLDGELIVGLPNDHHSLRNTMSGITRHVGECDVTFHVFDNYLLSGSFAMRFHTLAQNIAIMKKEYPRLSLVEHYPLTTTTELKLFEQDCLDRGFEGIMLRNPEGPYKFGRSTPREDYLWKVKRFEDAEATIVEFEEEMQNDNELQTNELGKAKRTSHKANKSAKGTLGGLVVVGLNGRYKGVQYRVGMGFTDAEAQHIWDNKEEYRGQICKVKYFPVGNLNKPAHTVWLGLRPDGV